jgi:hypothetical protein
LALYLFPLVLQHLAKLRATLGRHIFVDRLPGIIHKTPAFAMLGNDPLNDVRLDRHTDSPQTLRQSRKILHKGLPSSKVRRTTAVDHIEFPFEHLDTTLVSALCDKWPKLDQLRATLQSGGLVIAMLAFYHGCGNVALFPRYVRVRAIRPMIK